MFNESAKIRRENQEREFLYNNVVVLKLIVNSIDVRLYNNRQEENRINRRIGMQTAQFYKYASTELYSQAVSGYKYAMANGYPFHQYEAILDYQVAYNKSCFLSVYRDSYEFTGGAHGITTRRADTWNLNSGRLVPLGYYFDKETNYFEKILAQIIRQASKNLQENPGIYFDNYKTLIIKNFNPESYYLTDEGLSIFYQQYDIAPYSTGIVVFTLPFSELDREPMC